MRWETLTEDALAEAFNDRELEAVVRLRTDAATDPVPGIIAGVAARVRSAVLSGGRCRLSGGDGDIPAALRGEAVAILRLRLLLRFALSVTEERKDEAVRAEQRLDEIAKGTLPFASDTVAAAPTYHAKPQRWKTPPHGGIM